MHSYFLGALQCAAHGTGTTAPRLPTLAVADFRVDLARVDSQHIEQLLLALAILLREIPVQGPLFLSFIFSETQIS